MKLESLLQSVRPLSLLIQKPSSDDSKFWDIPTEGIHHEHIKAAVQKLRKDQEHSGKIPSKDPTLKTKDLLNHVAKALGADSYEHWLRHEEPRLAQFMEDHGLHQTSDLIKWENPPLRPLTARQVADRFFCSDRPLPERLFTGVGNLMFAARGYGKLDLINVVSKLTLNGQLGFSNTKLINFALTHHDQIVLRAKSLNSWSLNTPDYLDLKAQELVLNAFIEVSALFN